MRKNLLVLLSMFGALGCGGAGLLDSVGQSLDPRSYRLTDSGIRCTTAPCPSLLAVSLDGGKSVLVSEIEFPSSMAQEDRVDVISRAATSGGLVVSGEVQGDEPARVFKLDSVLE